MNRRQALIGLAGLTVTLELAAHSSQEAGVCAIIFKRLGYLNLSSPDVRRFARDYVGRGLMSAGKLRAVSAVAALYRVLPQSWENLVSADVGHGEERIVTTFLLSSNLFRNAGKPPEAGALPVRYLGLFDPLRGGNPFARLREQAGWGTETLGTAAWEESC